MDEQWVEAAVPLEPTVIIFAPLEQLAPRFWFATVLCFPLSSSAIPYGVYSRLRAGLSRTLVQLPLMAGRIERGAEEEKVQIRIKADAGVNFFLKDHHGDGSNDGDERSNRLPTYPQLKARHFGISALNEFGSDLLELPPISEGSGVFRAQANFVTGGLLLAIGFSHAVADGESLGTVQRIWARNTNEAAAQTAIPRTLLFDEDRAKLSQSNDNGTIPDDYPWSVKDRAEDHLITLPKLENPQTTSLKQPSVCHKVSWVSCVIWYISPEKLRDLKKIASPIDKNQWISTLDALSAFLWQRTLIARGLSSRGYPEAFCYLSMNVRSRIQPPLHSDFLGNAVDLYVAKGRTADIEGSNLDELPQLAAKMRQAIQAWSQTAFESLVGIMKSLPATKTFSLSRVPACDPGTMITDFTKTHSYTTDWGDELGFIDCIRFLLVQHDLTVEPGFATTAFILLPLLANGGIEIISVIGPDVTETLRRDAIFTRFVDFVCV